MKKFFDNIVTTVKNWFTGLSKKEKIRLLVLVASVVVLAVVVTILLGRTDYGVLYSGLDAAEAGSIVSALTGMGIPYKTEGTGTILIPSDRVSETRMLLSSEGYNSGSFDYSIFSGSTGFGTTDQEKQTFKNYQLQENIRQSLLKMSRIKDCLVIINPQNVSSFVLSSANQPATASVWIEVQGGGKLSESEAYTIAELVAASVQGLSIENVRIGDSQMNLYTISEDGESGQTAGSAKIAEQMKLTADIKQMLEAQVESFLANVFGEKNVKALVNVSLNFDKTSIQDIRFSPPVDGETGGIIVSMKELYEQSRYVDGAGGIPGTDSNGMGTAEYPYAGLDEDQYYSYALREMNYEINETVTMIEQAQGGIENLSIAVMIDSEAIEEDYTETVRNLMSNALGIPLSLISVARLPFTETETALERALAEQEGIRQEMQRQDLIKTIIMYVVIALIALFVFLLVRYILRTVWHKDEPEIVYADGTVGSSVNYLAGEGDGSGDGFPESMYKDVDISSKPEGILMIEKFIDKDPEAVAQLLRNWLTDD